MKSIPNDIYMITLKTLIDKLDVIIKYKDIDYKDAKEDVIPLIKNPESIDIWSS